VGISNDFITKRPRAFNSSAHGFWWRH